MITFESYTFFNEALKNDDVLLALIEAGFFGYGGNQEPAPNVDDQLNKQYQDNLRRQARSVQMLSDLVKNKKNELLQALQPLSNIPIIRDLIVSIKNER